MRTTTLMHNEWQIAPQTPYLYRKEKSKKNRKKYPSLKPNKVKLISTGDFIERKYPPKTKKRKEKEKSVVNNNSLKCFPDVAI